MTVQLDTLEEVAAGRLTVAQSAATLGLTPADVTRQLEMLGLARAMAKREIRAAKRQLGARVVALVAVLAVTSTLWFTRAAWAQAACSQTLPTPLRTFCPNDPALATEINGNFQQVINWVQAKIGPIGTPNISTASVSTTSLSVGQKIRGNAQIGTQGYEIDWNRSGFIGETDFVNFPDQGLGGFRFYNGGNLLASITNGGELNVLSINGRRPSFVATNSCSTSTCTASCAPGVVKQGWGFHGTNGLTNQVNLSSFACGSAYSWMGNCINQTSCTITTGCGSSSIWLDCW